MRMRGKTQMTKIEDISARQVTFSKRRQGLVKKARELAILCEAQAAVIVVSPTMRLHQYSSSNIKDILNNFSAHLNSERQLTRSQEERSNSTDLSRGIEDKIDYLRLIRSSYLQHFSVNELQRLEKSLEAKLEHVTAKKRQLLESGVPALQTKDLQTTDTLKPQPRDKNPTIPNDEAGIQCSYKTLNSAKSGATNYSGRWSRPPHGAYKVNFSGANFQDGNGSGIGVVIRNWEGEFMAAVARFLPDLVDVNMTCLVAAKCAAEFAVDYYFTNIVLEGDDQKTIIELKNAQEIRLEDSNGILHEIMRYVTQLGSCFLSHVQITDNSAAHMVAKYASYVRYDELVWLMEEPDFLRDTLQADINQ